MSGGVDSSVAAALLKNAGHSVVGVFMRNGVKPAVPAPVRAAEGDACAPAAPRRLKQGCCGIDDARDARLVAASLAVPFQVFDLEHEFGSLIDYFAREYSLGRTPNPCAVCNRDLKFGRLLQLADELGIERVATGHYVQLERTAGGRVALRRGRDAQKDQSYVLFPVAERALARCEFPVGHLPKSEVRALARELGLRTQDKPDSQEICFVPSGDYRDVLRSRGAVLRPGRFIDRRGKDWGPHEGIELFTIGQRRGLGLAAGEPLYVLEIRPETGEVVIGTREELGSAGFLLRDANWIGIDPPREGEELVCAVQIRSRGSAAAARVRATANSVFEVSFEEEQLAVTPGQGAVLYDGDRCLGGGWIELRRTVAATASAL
ncbi:MAG: tRNA 2-thiouridine(34) synthase MnmA [Planctomycetes bacterium]|nr:tRNA 2-thiouridine(34) synthase MnmA [Planctomycetota bacterium]